MLHLVVLLGYLYHQYHLLAMLSFPAIFFPTALAFLLLHEMDAVRCKEWRIFPGLSALPDGPGFAVFMWAHVPLYGALVFFLQQPEPMAFMRGFDIFMIVHLGLHLLFLRHPRNEFKDALSWTFIVGAAVFGALHLVFSEAA